MRTIAEMKNVSAVGDAESSPTRSCVFLFGCEIIITDAAAKK